jgi:hypothetical protein
MFCANILNLQAELRVVVILEATPKLRSPLPLNPRRLWTELLLVALTSLPTTEFDGLASYKKWSQFANRINFGELLVPKRLILTIEQLIESLFVLKRFPKFIKSFT